MITIESADPPGSRRCTPSPRTVSACGRSLDRDRCFASSRRARRKGCYLWRTRAVDVAAAQLIVREAGGLVAFPAFDDPLGAPLDIEPHSPVVAARTPASLARLSAIVWPSDATPEG